MPDEIFHVWLAGFIDGEGSIDIAKKGRSYCLRLTITNTNLEVLEKIRERVGAGHVEKKSHGTLTRRTCYRFCCTYHTAKKNVRRVLPYLQIKKEHAEIGLTIPHLSIHERKRDWHGRLLPNPELKKAQREIQAKLKRLNTH